MGFTDWLRNRHPKAQESATGTKAEAEHRRSFESRTAEEIRAGLSRDASADYAAEQDQIEEPPVLTAPSGSMVDHTLAPQVPGDGPDVVVLSDAGRRYREAEDPIAHVEGELRGRRRSTRPTDKGQRPMPQTAGLEVSPEDVEVAAEVTQTFTDHVPQHPREAQPGESEHTDLEGGQWRVHAGEGIVYLAGHDGEVQAQFSARDAAILGAGVQAAASEAEHMRVQGLREH